MSEPLALRKLRLSVQGMKTQQGYLRDRVGAIESRLQAMDSIDFKTTLILLSLACFYFTLISGYLVRCYG